jgi:hypothetical protein
MIPALISIVLSAIQIACWLYWATRVYRQFVNQEERLRRIEVILCVPMNLLSKASMAELEKVAREKAHNPDLHKNRFDLN